MTRHSVYKLAKTFDFVKVKTGQFRRSHIDEIVQVVSYQFFAIEFGALCRVNFLFMVYKKIKTSKYKH